MAFKSFRSPTPDTRRIALTTGHIYLIGPEWSPLPDFAWTEAYAAGCISEDMNATGIPSEVLRTLSDEAALLDEVKAVIQEAIDDSVAEAFFKTSGAIKPAYVRNKLSRPELPIPLVEKAWAKIQLGE